MLVESSRSAAEIRIMLRNAKTWRIITRNICVSAHLCNLLPTICWAIHILHHVVVFFLSKYVFIECVIKLFVPVNFDYELTSANFIVFSTLLVAKKHNAVLINQFRSLKNFFCYLKNAILHVKYHRSDISIEWQEKE